MKKRLELISGEIEAGNNNKELLKEAHGILLIFNGTNERNYTCSRQSILQRFKIVLLMRYDHNK